MSAALERAVSDVLARGLPAGLARSAVGVELGQQLQSAITAEIADGATPDHVLDALQDACGDPLTYAVLLELLLAASLDELQVIAGLPGSGLERGPAELPPAPSRRSAHRRR